MTLKKTGDESAIPLSVSILVCLNSSQKLLASQGFFVITYMDLYLLASDFTKVTPWLMSSKLENRAFRYTVSGFNLPEGVFCEMLGGGVPAGH